MMKKSMVAIPKQTDIIEKILYFIYIFLTLMPIAFIGITCNDDLQWRMYATEGFGTLAKAYFEAAKVQGRVLSCTQIISLFIAVFPNTIVHGIVKVMLIFSNIWLIGKFIKIFFDDKIRKFWMIIMPLLVQVTINHCPPDAFVSFIAFPMSLFLISLISYNAYLKTRKKILYAISLFLYFWSICSYEYFIVLSPLYLIVNMKSNLKESIGYKKMVLRSFKGICGHIIVGCSYLILYFLQRYIFPSNYMGNQLVFSNVKQSANVEWMIIKSGIPGGYYFSPKGLYLNNLGNELISTNKNLNTLSIIRIICVLVLAIWGIF